MVEDGFALASRDFMEEITAAAGARGMARRRYAGGGGRLGAVGSAPPAQATHAIRELVLARFVSPDGVHSDDHS